MAPQDWEGTGQASQEDAKLGARGAAASAAALLACAPKPAERTWLLMPPVMVALSWGTLRTRGTRNWATCGYIRWEV